MRVPLPTVQQSSVSGNGEYSAPATTPRPDATGRQLQELGNGMQQLGVAGFNLGARLQNEVDVATVERADSIASEAFQRHLYDPKTGFLNTVGVDAVTGDKRQKAFDSLDEEMKRIEGGLSNERQRQDFSRVRDHRMQEAQAKADAHVTKETRTYAYGSAVARAEAAMNDAQNNVGSPVLFAGYRQIMLDSVNKAADVQGMSDEQRKMVVLGATTKLHADVVDGYIAQGKTEQARGYLADAVKQGEVEATTAYKLGRVVQIAGIEDEAAKVAVSVEAEILKDAKAARGALNQDEPLTPEAVAKFIPNAVAKIDAMGLPEKVRSAAISRIEQDYDRQRKADNAQVQALVDRAESTLIANPNMSWRQLEKRDIEELDRRGMLPVIVGFSDSGNRYSTDPTFDAEMESKDLTKIDEKEFKLWTKGLLSPARQNYWLAEIARSKGTATKDQTRIAGMEGYKKDAARFIGILPTGRTPSSAETEAYEAWQIDFDKRVLAPWEEAHKRKATDDEVIHLLDIEKNSKVNVTTKGNIWDSTESVPLSSLPQGRMGPGTVTVDGREIALKDIPDAYWAEIAADLEAHHQLPTPENIAARYVRVFKPELLNAPTAPAAQPYRNNWKDVMDQIPRRNW